MRHLIERDDVLELEIRLLPYGVFLFSGSLGEVSKVHSDRVLKEFLNVTRWQLATQSQ